MESNFKIVLLSHTASGNGKGAEIAHKVKVLLDRKNIPNILYQNEWPDELNNEGQVWIAGGDGTIFHFINKYPGITMPIALLGGGTGNDLKTHLYKNHPLEEHVDALLKSKPFMMDLGRCNDYLYANSLGIGFDGEVLKNIGAIRWVGGHLGYLLAVIKAIFTFREKSFKLYVDQESFTIKPVILAFSNSMLTGGGFIIAPKSSLEDGMLDLLYTEPLPWWKRLLVLPSVEKGKHINFPYVHHRHVTKVEIEATEEVHYQIDGELKSAKKFSIEIAPHKLPVLQYPEK